MGKLTFGTTGLAYQVDEVKVNVGGAPICPRCNQRVYFNEEKRAMQKSWHTRCFSCVKCKKKLDSTNCSGHEGEVYCTPCHKREFGPKGYGFAGGASGLSTESTTRDVRPTAHTTVHAVPSQLRGGSTTISSCSDPESCPRCGNKVYFAEEVKALRRKWHRLCFKCGGCNKMLEPGRCNEAEGDVYCTACYGRQYGPKGYGFAGGAGATLSSNSHPLYPSHHQQNPQQNQQQYQQHRVSPTPTPKQVVTERTGPPVNGHGTQSWTEAVYI